MKNLAVHGQRTPSRGYMVPIEGGHLFVDNSGQTRQSQRAIRRYLLAFEVMSIIALLSMGYLFLASRSPAQGEGLFVDVVSGKIFALIGRNSF